MLLDAPDSRGSKRPFCTAPIFHPEDRERRAPAQNAGRAATEGLSRCSDRFPRALRTCPGPNLDLSSIGERLLRHEDKSWHMPGKNGRDPNRLRAKHWGVFRRAQDLDSLPAPPVRRLLE